MLRANYLARHALGILMLAIAAAPLSAQRRETTAQWLRDCERGWGSRDGERFCTTSESTVPRPSGTLVVDGRVNGGVSVIGTNRRDVLIVARIQANARSEERAEEIAKAIRIHSEGGKIYADGPDTRNREWWSVSFEIEVPAQSDLDLTAQNGGISVSAVTGTLRMDTQNGGIHLDGVGGDVVAETTNGGLHIQLDGNRWEGKGLDATTTNGGVHAVIPRDYSAHLVTGTTNGGVDIDFPVTVQGKIGRRITTDLGRGGATIRMVTMNGGVDIKNR
jgi:hypothetical protein